MRTCIFLLFFFIATPISSAVKQFELGSLHTYSYESTILLNEAKSGRKLPENSKDVGYQVTGQIQVASVWQNPMEHSDKILQIQLKSPILHIKSRKAPAPDGFVEHKSELETLSNAAFLIHWNAGQVEELYAGDKEDRSIVNLKRGIASLFQFRTLDMESKESDVSGACSVKYSTIDGHTFLKTKSSCSAIKPTVAPYIFNPDKVLSGLVTSQRESKITLNPDLSILQSVETSELHELVTAMRQEAGASVQATQELKITDNPGNAKPVKAATIEAAVTELGSNLGVTFVKQNLMLEAEPQTCQSGECPTLSKLVKENREQLSAANLGTIKSSMAFIRLLKVARNAKKEEFIKVLNNKKNADILPQLMDLAAATQTLAAHSAVMKVLDFNSDTEIALPERYLWSLSMGSHPVETVIKDVLTKSESELPSPKLTETLILTAAAMTNKWLKLPGNAKKKLKDEVKDSIERRLGACSDDNCKQVYIRAIRNLGSSEFIPQLIELVQTGNKKTGVAAMQAIHGLPKMFRNEKEVRELSKKVFLQLGKRYDSSARTLAVDILLESGVSKDELREMLESLKMAKRRDSQEVGQYTLQRIRHIAEKCSDLHTNFRDLLLEENGRLNGYHVLAQRGMASAFTREFLSSSSSNGSLISTLELAGGILKRSALDIHIQTGEEETILFTLGMFAGGLSAFVSSDEPAPDEEEEIATAGMELTVLGVGVRPFVFFNGQGELMGHVWSGSGSERTAAFQTLTTLQDHQQAILLQSGFIADISLLGAASFELAGQVSLSLWNRKAHSIVEKNVGVVLLGLIRVDTSFVKSHVEFTVAAEPRLNLVTDVNFHNTVALCLQLKQPDSIVKHNIHKVERIPGSKHRLRKSKYMEYHVPGKTYALNKKNNEMCNALFQD